MGKKDTEEEGNLVAQEKQKNKSHKTLREKLRKKRLHQKEHLKQKKQKRKKFDPQAQKRSFFLQHFNSISEDKYKQAKKHFKYKKVTKYIEKFINVYQDDLQDFFALFNQFDQGGFIDISGLQNKKLHKILVKLFAQLPLTTTEKNDNGAITIEYRKKNESTLRLENAIRDLVTKAIENYMENGTQDEKSGGQGSSGDEDERKLKQLRANKKDKDVTVNIRNEDDGTVFTLPKPKYEKNSCAGASFGPSISVQERQKIAELFEKQLQQMQRQKQAQQQAEEDNFDKIFNTGQTANKLKHPQKGPKKSTLQDFPQQLMAQGSARIGEKVSINEEEQKQYDAIHRPKKLIEEHREIMAINRGQSLESSVKRKPFDRERDVLNSRSKMGVSSMSNGLFFNFGDKMTAPKKTNSFL